MKKWRGNPTLFLLQFTTSMPWVSISLATMLWERRIGQRWLHSGWIQLYEVWTTFPYSSRPPSSLTLPARLLRERSWISVLPMASGQGKWWVSPTISWLGYLELMPQEEEADVRKPYLYIHGAPSAPSEGRRYMVYPGVRRSPGSAAGNTAPLRKSPTIS